MSDLSAAVSAVDEALYEYERAQRYYTGETRELFPQSWMERLFRSTTDEFMVNLSRRPVEAVLDRLEIASLLVPNNQPLTNVLQDKVWDANRLGRVAKLVHRTALVNGDAYLLVWPGEEDGSVDVYRNSPLQMRLFYDAENPSRKSYAAKVWCVGEQDDQQVRVNLYYADRIEKWISKRGTKGDEDSHFEEYLDEESAVWPIANPYGEVPVFHFRTDEPYGRPEHRDAYGPQNLINKFVGNQVAAADFQGFPQRYRLRTAGAPGLADAALDDQFGSGDEAPLTASPGTVWDLTDTDSVGQFDAADPGVFLDPISHYTRTMASITTTPLRHFDPTGQIPSGEALRAQEAPFVKKVRDRQTWFGDEWQAAMVFAMKVIGSPVETVAVSWHPAEVADDLESWKTVAQKIAIGVPREVALAEAGYLPEDIAGWTTPPPPAAPPVQEAS